MPVPKATAAAGSTNHGFGKISASTSTAEDCEQCGAKGEQDRTAGEQSRRQARDEKVAPSLSEQGRIANWFGGNDGLEVGKRNEARDQERDHVHGLQRLDTELADRRRLPADIARQGGQHDGKPGGEGDPSARRTRFDRKQHERRPRVADGQHRHQYGRVTARPEVEVQQDAEARESERLDRDQSPHGATARRRYRLPACRASAAPTPSPPPAANPCAAPTGRRTTARQRASGRSPA